MASVLNQEMQFLNSDLWSIDLVQFLSAIKAENINSIPKVNIFLSTSNCEVLVLGDEVKSNSIIQRCICV